MIDSRADLLQEVLSRVDALVSYQRRAFCARPHHRHPSMPQVFILMMLRERGPLTVSELSDLLGVSMPSTSSILDRMEEHSLVERTRAATDRRVVHVAITEPGRTILDELGGVKRDQMQRLLSVMDDAELLAVIQGIDALRRALERIGAVEVSSGETFTGLDQP